MAVIKGDDGIPSGFVPDLAKPFGVWVTLNPLARSAVAGAQAGYIGKGSYGQANPSGREQAKRGYSKEVTTTHERLAH
jgi:hypothetical protein